MKIGGVGAIVTGGASGLGRAAVKRLAEVGGKVAIFDLDQTLGSALAAETGGSFHRIDVSDADAVADAIFEAERLHGKARILVNCAGIGRPARVIGSDGAVLPLADFQSIVSINLVGSFNVLSQFAQRLHDADLANAEERGVIVNTASIAAFDGQIGQAAYAASKAGIVGMTLPIAREFARYGIRVVTIAPGLFLTPALASLPQDVLTTLGGQVPFPRRLGDPDEYAQMVEAIVLNPMVNGETIRLDGAMRMGPK